MESSRSRLPDPDRRTSAWSARRTGRRPPPARWNQGCPTRQGRSLWRCRCEGATKAIHPSCTAIFRLLGFPPRRGRSRRMQVPDRLVRVRQGGEDDLAFKAPRLRERVLGLCLTGLGSPGHRHCALRPAPSTQLRMLRMLRIRGALPASASSGVQSAARARREA